MGERATGLKGELTDLNRIRDLVHGFLAGSLQAQPRFSACGIDLSGAEIMNQGNGRLSALLRAFGEIEQADKAGDGWGQSGFGAIEDRIIITERARLKE